MHITENNNYHMENWYNKIAIVTGADEIIGGIIANVLVNKGLIVMGLAKNIDIVLKIRSELPTTLRYRLYPIRCDITIDDQVEKAFTWINNTYGGIDMLINSAGILYGNKQLENITNDIIKENLNYNLNGIKNCTKRAYLNMKNRMVKGHIILMDSILGDNNSKLSGYSKDIINEITEIYRKEFFDINNDGDDDDDNFEAKNNIKLTCITSGFCETEIISTNIKRQTLYYPMLEPYEFSNIILNAVSNPSLMEINEIVLKSQ